MQSAIHQAILEHLRSYKKERESRNSISAKKQCREDNMLHALALGVAQSIKNIINNKEIHRRSLIISVTNLK